MKTRNMITAAALILLVLFAASAFAQSKSATATTPISAIKAESMTISASGLTQFDLAALSAQTLSIQSYWNLKPQRTSVAICVYMDPTTGVMKGTDVTNTDVIDQTMVQAKVGAGSFANINGGTGCGIASGVTVIKSYTLATQADRKVSSSSPKNDSVSIQLNAVPATIQADTYTGALTVVAYAL